MQLFYDLFMKISMFLDFRNKLKITELNKESSTIHILEINMSKEYKFLKKFTWNLGLTDKILSQNKYTLLESLELKGDKHIINSFKYLTKLKTLRIDEVLECFNDLPINLTSLSIYFSFEKNIDLNYLQNLTYLNITNTMISLESIIQLKNLKKLYMSLNNSNKDFNFFPNLEEFAFMWEKEINYDKCVKLHTLDIYITKSEEFIKLNTHNITSLSILFYVGNKIHISDISKLKYLELLSPGNYIYDFRNSCLEKVNVTEARIQLPKTVTKLISCESNIYNLKDLTNLTYLDISFSPIRGKKLLHLTKLKTLFIEKCKNIKEKPNIPSLKKFSMY